MNRHLLAIGILFTLISGTTLAVGQTTTSPLEGWGFEIGNGKRIIRNLNEMYGRRVGENWEMSYSGRFTEILASLVEGSPRARLQINMISPPNIQTFQDLANLFLGSARGWSVTKVGNLDAVSKEVTLSTGRCVLDMRVFRAPKDVAVITLDSAPDCRGESTYDKIRSSLDTFRFIQ